MSNPDLLSFLSPEAVAEVLSISSLEVEELIASGELLAFRVGIHGPWRIELAQLEVFVEHQYEHARRSKLWNQAALGDIPELADGRLL